MTSNVDDISQSVVLRSVAEQLKTPLMIIARQAELQHRTQQSVSSEEIKATQLQADIALRLVDSYLLGLDLIDQQMEIALEPVPIAALLYDIAHELTPIAKQNNTRVELEVAGKYGQIMGHAAGLRAALHGLGAVMSEVSSDTQPVVIKIAAHKRPTGIVVGIYSSVAEQMQASLIEARQAQKHYRRQSLVGMSSGSGAGVLVADAIFSAMHTPLRAGRYKKQQGLAATFMPSQQLQLV